MHDARHFYAIRAVRAGTPYELVARQLGHADVTMVAKVYGRFAPRSDERDRWEKIAAQMDALHEKTAKNRAVGTAAGTASADALRVEKEITLASNDADEGYADSRGGTRTHDPGIMSAVL